MCQAKKGVDTDITDDVFDENKDVEYINGGVLDR
jgi:hypothetical protein